MAVPGCLTSVYRELQTSRLNVSLPLPSVLKNPFQVLDVPPSSAAGNPGTFYNIQIHLCSMSKLLDKLIYTHTFIYSYVHIYTHIVVAWLCLL